MGRIYALICVDLYIQHNKEIALAKTLLEIRAVKAAHERRANDAFRNTTNAELAEFVDDMATDEFLSGVWEPLSKGQRRAQIAELKALRDKLQGKYPHLHHSISPSLR